MALRSGIRAMLGTMTWGPTAQTPKLEAVKQIRCALAHIEATDKLILDTARMYQTGDSEEVIGQIRQEHPDIRDKTEVHTKAIPMVGPLSKEGLRTQVNGALEALQMDSIDLFYLHAPDISVPIEEKLECCDQMHREGKFRKLGLSNYAAWDVVRINSICKQNNWIIPEVYQGCYNAINKRIEPELLPAVRALGMKFYAYNPLAAGMLTGRYNSAADFDKSSGRFSGAFDFVSKDSKMTRMNQFKGGASGAYRKRYGSKANFAAIAEINAVKGDLSLAEVALRWLKHHSWLRAGDGILVGASKIEQAEANFTALSEGPLNENLVEACERAGFIASPSAEAYFRNYGVNPGSSELFLAKFD